MGCASSTFLDEPMVLDDGDYNEFLRQLHDKVSNSESITDADHLRMRSMINLMSPYQLRKRFEQLMRLAYPNYVDTIERLILAERLTQCTH